MKRYVYSTIAATLGMTVLGISGQMTADALLRVKGGIGIFERECGVPGFDLQTIGLLLAVSLMASAVLISPISMLVAGRTAAAVPRKVAAAALTVALACTTVATFNSVARPIGANTVVDPVRAVLEYVLGLSVPVFVASLIAQSVSAAIREREYR